MIRRILSLTLFLNTITWVTVTAQSGPIADITGRDECDPHEYVDPEVTVDQLVDSAGMMDRVHAFRHPEPDGFSVQLAISGDGELRELTVSANGHTTAEREALARQLRLLVRPQAVTGIRRSYMLGFDSSDEFKVDLFHGGWTCNATLRNRDAVARAFAASIRRIRGQGIVGSSQGEVVVTVRVTPDGAPRDIRVQQTSGVPEVDRAAIEAMQHASFFPGVIGRRAVATAFTQRLAY